MILLCCVIFFFLFLQRMVALMSPEDSWVAKWQRISKSLFYFFLSCLHMTFDWLFINKFVCYQTTEWRVFTQSLCQDDCPTVLSEKWRAEGSPTGRETQVRGSNHPHWPSSFWTWAGPFAITRAWTIHNWHWSGICFKLYTTVNLSADW